MLAKVSAKLVLKMSFWKPKHTLKVPLGVQTTLMPFATLKHDKLPSLEPKHVLKCPLESR